MLFPKLSTHWPPEIHQESIRFYHGQSRIDETYSPEIFQGFGNNDPREYYIDKLIKKPRRLSNQRMARFLIDTAYAAPILYIPVLQTGHLPFIAGFPFFIVTF